jgi:hypothetical protein
MSIEVCGTIAKWNGWVEASSKDMKIDKVASYTE